MIEARFRDDIDLVQSLLPDRRSAFEEWMRSLDAEHERQGSPYGDGSLWETTGAKCWFDWFDEGQSPADALAEDKDSWSE